MYRSTRREILRKRPKKHLCILGDCWEKFICSSFPAKTDGRVPSQQSAPTTGSLTYCEVSQQTHVQILLPSLVVRSQGKIQPFIEGGGGGVMLIQAPQTKLVLNLLLKGYLAIIRTKNHMKSISRKHTDYKTPQYKARSKNSAFV